MNSEVINYIFLLIQFKLVAWVFWHLQNNYENLEELLRLRIRLPSHGALENIQTSTPK